MKRVIGITPLSSLQNTFLDAHSHHISAPSTTQIILLNLDSRLYRYRIGS